MCNLRSELDDESDKSWGCEWWSSRSGVSVLAGRRHRRPQAGGNTSKIGDLHKIVGVISVWSPFMSVLRTRHWRLALILFWYGCGGPYVERNRERRTRQMDRGVELKHQTTVTDLYTPSPLKFSTCFGTPRSKDAPGAMYLHPHRCSTLAQARQNSFQAQCMQERRAADSQLDWLLPAGHEHRLEVEAVVSVSVSCEYIFQHEILVVAALGRSVFVGAPTCAAAVASPSLRPAASSRSASGFACDLGFRASWHAT